MSEYRLELLEDLGKKVVGTKGRTVRIGVFKCPICLKGFVTRFDSVSSQNTTKCKSCSSKSTFDRAKLLEYASTQAKYLFAKAKELLLEDFHGIHGDTYDYSDVLYQGARVAIEIKCKEHGVFKQTPNNHKQGQGCPKCALSRSNIAKRQADNSVPTKLYYIYLPSLNLWKIGCTSKSNISDRFHRDNIDIEELLVREYPSHIAYNIEDFLLKETKLLCIKEKPLASKGNTELRSAPIDNILELIEEAENKFKGAECTI